MKKISVVLPVYNGEKYLGESIQSIINQTYTNWELIIVNDASIDNSCNIIDQFMKIDSKIKCINNQINQKLPESLNIGFRQACGEYLTWTSDDNIYVNNAFEIMAKALDEGQEYGMVFCDQNFIDEEGNLIGNNSIGREKDASKLFIQDCIGACFMYRHIIIETIGEYDPNMFLVEDYDYWIRLSFMFKIKHINIKAYFYRFHSNTLSEIRVSDVMNKKVLFKLKYLDTAMDLFSKNELKQIYISTLLCNKSVSDEVRDKLISRGLLDDSYSWIDKERKLDKNKKFIIFGAGRYGKLALKYIGIENVEYFADNIKIGIDISTNLKILSFDELKMIWKGYNIVIGADGINSVQIAEQFECNGIDKYLFYLEMIS
jgi:glycosyltransferase involved in cell wall biosynthesis